MQRWNPPDRAQRQQPVTAYKWRDGAWKIKSCQWDKLSCKNKTQKNCYCSWTKTFHKLENSIQRLAREVLLKHQIRIWDTAASTRNWTNFKSELTKPREEAPEGSVLIESKHQKRKAIWKYRNWLLLLNWKRKTDSLNWIGEAIEGIAECQLLPPLW